LIIGRPFIQTNPHKSFVPFRCPTPACWFIDGSTYMSAVADALENASEEIFIADWWLSPEIFMKRPAVNGEYWRLDNILQRRAVSNLKNIYYVLYYLSTLMAYDFILLQRKEGNKLNLLK
jgi:phospholipase D1/2